MATGPRNNSARKTPRNNPARKAVDDACGETVKVEDRDPTRELIVTAASFPT